MLKLASVLVGLGTAFVVVELLSSVVLLYRYRFSHPGPDRFQHEPSSLSSVNLVIKAARLAGLLDSVETRTEYRHQTVPAPFRIEDSVYGYVANPGRYQHTYQRRDASDEPWRSFRVQATINADRSRWTGREPLPGARNVWILGDSFTFGSGVNDEQTYAFQLQHARPDLNVRLFALGGYSLAQAYLRVLSLRDQIGADDWVVLGYADFYDLRHVAAPSHLRRVNRWRTRWNADSVQLWFRVPRVTLDAAGSPAFDYVLEDCANNAGYCEQDDPEQAYQTRVTATLVNAIAAMTPARVFLLHFDGKADNPVFAQIDPRVERISALPEDFDYFIRDDVEGFDAHPGPYWHYAISRRLLDALPAKKARQQASVP